MDYNKRRKLVLIAIAAFVVLFIGLIIFTIVKNSGPSGNATNGVPSTKVTTDKDTGDQIIKVPGKTPEIGGNTTQILGGDSLIDKTSFTDTQYNLIVDTLSSYAKTHISITDTLVGILKFIPSSITGPAADGSYSVHIKTESPAAEFDATIYPIGLDRIRIVAVKSGSATYDSGITPAYDTPSTEFDSGNDQPFEPQTE